jgi:hypothetical protein
MVVDDLVAVYMQQVEGLRTDFPYGGWDFKTLLSIFI